jgi:hypothetical protein
MLEAGRAARGPAVAVQEGKAMPQRDLRVAVGERNTGMSKIGRTTWRAGAVGLVLSGLLAGVLHNTVIRSAHSSRSAGSTSGQSQVTGPASPPGSSSGSSQVISGGS